MLEYYKHNKRKVSSAMDTIPVLFYNAGLFLWHVVGRDLFFLKCDLKEKFKTKHKERTTTDIYVPEIGDELLDRGIETIMSEIEKDVDEETVGIERPHFIPEEKSSIQVPKEDNSDLLLLMKTFYHEEIITTPYIETLTYDMFEFKAEDGRQIVLTSSEKTLLLGVEKPGEYISLSRYKYQREGYYKGEVLIIINK